MSRGPGPAPLPAEFRGRAFSVREGQAAGVSVRRSRASDLDAAVRGVRAPHDDDTLERRARLLLTRMPAGTWISSASAALLWGAPLPRRIENDPVVHLAVRAPARAPHAEGISGHAFSIDPESDLTVWNGLSVASPGRCWIEVAALLDLGDLVAVGDFFIHHGAPLVSYDELSARVERLPRGRGVSRLRRAVCLLDPRAESRPESLMRLLLIDAGFPPPTINHVIVETETGRRRRADFAYPDRKISIEYQGGYHRTPEQWRADMIRRRALEAQGWTIIEANWDDIRDPAALVADLRAAFAR